MSATNHQNPNPPSLSNLLHPQQQNGIIIPPPRTGNSPAMASTTSSSSSSSLGSGSGSGSLSSAPSAASTVSIINTLAEEITPRGSTSSDGLDGGRYAFTVDELDPDNSDKYPASMTESIREHVFEGGIRYHAYKSGKYAFPNDEIEQNRDDMKHSMCLMLCQGKYFYAPVEEMLERGGEVLDLGTGTGIWPIELGDKYPDATFTGIDLSPIQPNLVPENVHFFIDDFEEEWVDPVNKYDYIHVRHTLHSVQNPQLLFQRAMQHLKPGGYLEIQEIEGRPQADDGSISPSTPYAFRDYITYMSAGLRAMGSEMNAIVEVADLMKSTGFEDVQIVTHKAPLGMWPRDKRLRLCGLFMRTVIMDGLRGISHRPLTALGWTQLQIEMFLVDVRKAVMDNKVHAYFPYHVVYGRKPLVEPEGI
ncbi:Phosphoethanolamine N-methyltransferase [Cladorrhinum samala]|uniref:Phosphoethanolamine N-methyltransferase n=1 Tax=Cladorrhinum samala TaxID=585594 RepID=A0AAV9HET1_9PEZI|nr:Phosphoethanolamine N-methyltransferase [Cladorrhinum samala]